MIEMHIARFKFAASAASMCFDGTGTSSAGRRKACSAVQVQRSAGAAQYSAAQRSASGHRSSGHA
jgi:hypothetical protein